MCMNDTASSYSLPGFWRYHLLWPAVIFLAFILANSFTGFDFILADKLYALQGGQWALRENFITSVILHKAAQKLSAITGLLFLCLAIGSHFNRRLAPYKKGFWLLFATVATGSAIVSIGKDLTHMDCPWDLQRYGGANPYIALFMSHPGNFNYGQCFPAGHASGGYGLFAFYFFFCQYQPRWKWYGLALGLGMGLLYGFTQQLRGAHFISHDLWSLAICWLSALFWHWILFQRKPAKSTAKTNTANN